MRAPNIIVNQKYLSNDTEYIAREIQLILMEF